MLRMTASLTCLLLITPAAALAGRIDAADGSSADVWRSQLEAAGMEPGTVASLEVVEMARGGGEVYRLLRQRVGGLVVYGEPLELVTTVGGDVVELEGEPEPVARDGALSSLIGDRQGLEFVLRYLLGLVSGRVRLVGVEEGVTVWVALGGEVEARVAHVALPAGGGEFEEGLIVVVQEGDGESLRVVLDGEGRIVEGACPVGDGLSMFAPCF